MKKIITLILTTTLLCAAFAACGAKAPKHQYATPTEAFTASFEKWFADENQQFPCVGGDDTSAGMVSAPLPMDVTKNYDESSLNGWFHMTEEQAQKVTAGACLMHMMNLNTFSSAVIDLAAGTDLKAWGEAYAETIKGVNWYCGFPDKLYVAEADGYIFLAFGEQSAIEGFKNSVTDTFDDAKEIFYDWITEGGSFGDDDWWSLGM